MDQNFHQCLAYTLQFEGGFCNIPEDPGGPTNKGITLVTYTNFCRQCGLADPTVEDLKAIPDDHVQSLYYNNFWKKCGADHLPSGLDFAAFDLSVNSGPSKAIKFLQEVLGQPATGKLASGVTHAAAGHPDQDQLISAYCERRKKFFYGIVAARPASSRFLKGWLRRVADLESAALKMNDADPHPDTIGKAAEDDHHEDTEA